MFWLQFEVSRVVLTIEKLVYFLHRERNQRNCTIEGKLFSSTGHLMLKGQHGEASDMEIKGSLTL